jgi:hypothetical protein
VKIYQSNIVCKKDENNATTSYHNVFGRQHPYNKSNLMQQVFSWIYGIIYCKRILSFVLYQESMVEAIGFTSMWVYLVSFLTVIQEWSAFRCCGQN